MRPDVRPHEADRPELSVIVPMYNEQDNVALLAERVHRALADVCPSYELLFVDDGSEDDSVAAVQELAARSRHVRLVALSRNFGKEAALLAGYDHAEGDAVLVVDADLQQPPELFPDLLALWRQGYDVVDAVRADTEGISTLRRHLSTAFYWANNKLSGVRLAPHTADFRLMDRAVADVVRGCREAHRFNRALIAWAGFRRAGITYTAARRHAGQTQWGWRKLLPYALNGILSFSIAPLRLVGWLGGVVSVLSFLYLLVVAVLRLTRPELAGVHTGYASIIGMIALLGGFQLLAIWVLGEYTGRIYEQVKARPNYLVRRPHDPHDSRALRHPRSEEEKAA